MMTRTKRDMPSDDRDATILVDLLPKGQGRHQPTPGREWFCRLGVQGRFFEVRLVSDAANFMPGQTTEAKVSFLMGKSAVEFIRPNVAIELWELRLVATGRIQTVVQTADAVAVTL